MNLNSRSISANGLIRISVCVAIVFGCIAVFTSVASAASDNDIVASYKQWQDYLSENAIYKDIFRWLGWQIISGISYLADELSKAVDSIYSLLYDAADKSSIFTNANFTSYFAKLKPYIISLFTIAILVFGYYLMFKRSDAQIGTFQNLLAILLVVTMMPQLAATFGEYTAAMSGGVKKAAYASSSPATSMLRSNVWDLTYIDENGRSAPSGHAFPDISHYQKSLSDEAAKKKENMKLAGSINNLSAFRSIKINEAITETNGMKHEDFFKNIVNFNGDGTYEVKKASNGIFGIGKEGYYRYVVSWWTLFFSVVSFCVCLVFTIFKVGRLLFEAVIAIPVGSFTVVTDLASGQRIKTFLTYLTGIFATFFLVAMLLGVYFIGLKYLADMHSLGKISGVVYVLLQMILAYTIIDGPNLIERIVGIDAGISSGFKMIVGAAAVANGMRRQAQSVAGVAKGSMKAAGAVKRGFVGTPFKKDELGRRSVGGIAGKAIDAFQQPKKNTALADGTKPDSFKESFKKRPEESMSGKIRTNKGKAVEDQLIARRNRKGNLDQAKYYGDKTSQSADGLGAGSIAHDNHGSAEQSAQNDRANINGAERNQDIAAPSPAFAQDVPKTHQDSSTEISSADKNRDASGSSSLDAIKSKGLKGRKTGSFNTRIPSQSKPSASPISQQGNKKSVNAEAGHAMRTGRVQRTSNHQGPGSLPGRPPSPSSAPSNLGKSNKGRNDSDAPPVPSIPKPRKGRDK